MSASNATDGESRGLSPALWIFALLAIAGAVAAFLVFARPLSRHANAEEANESAMEPPRRLPDFELSSMTGEKVTAASLRGRPSVVEFFFTTCPICALMNQGFQRLQRELPPEVRLISITVDPEHDTAEALQAYAARHDADPARWLFLRGELDTICDVMEQGFGYMRAANPAMHSLRFALVDADGELVKTYSPIEFGDDDEKSLSDAELSALVRDARQLLTKR
ncbi:MAG: SCO family protein [Planctomycetes bacterium]|nr:SCO family protein [Planctomycetota bacterium]